MATNHDRPLVVLAIVLIAFAAVLVDLESVREPDTYGVCFCLVEIRDLESTRRANRRILLHARFVCFRCVVIHDIGGVCHVRCTAGDTQWQRERDAQREQRSEFLVHDDFPCPLKHSQHRKEFAGRSADKSRQNPE